MLSYGDWKQMKIEEFFYSHPIFRQEEFAAFKSKQGISNVGTIYQALHHYLKTQRLVAVRRGLYAVVPPNETSEGLLIDPYLIAGKTAGDSILAYHTALEIHGAAYSLFQQFTFLTAQKVKSFSYQERWFQPVAIPQILKEKKAVNFGVEVINRAGLELRVTNVARTFVDVIARADLSGGWEEVCRSISNIAVLDIDEVIAYCFKLGSPVINAKVGFFLEQRQGAFAVSDMILQQLAAKKPKSPHYLIKSKREPSQFIKRWNLMMPKTILNRTWEEPNYDV